jgi:hypothetical protein
LYEGSIYLGRVHGKGRLIWSDGAYYIGMFREGKIHGKGVLVDKMGKVKKGFFGN